MRSVKSRRIVSDSISPHDPFTSSSLYIWTPLHIFLMFSSWRNLHLNYYFRNSSSRYAFHNVSMRSHKSITVKWRKIVSERIINCELSLHVARFFSTYKFLLNLAFTANPPTLFKWLSFTCRLATINSFMALAFPVCIKVPRGKLANNIPSSHCVRRMHNENLLNHDSVEN